MWSAEENEKQGACGCPYKRSCHLPRQWLQAKFREDYGTTVEQCDFYPKLKAMYDEKHK